MNTWLAVATFLYLLGTAKYLLYLGLRKNFFFVMATIMIAAGFITETVGLFERAAVTGHGPYHGVFEQLMFLAWTVFAAFLVAEGWFRIKPLGAFMAPFGLLLVVLAVVFSSTQSPSAVNDAYWLTLHRTLSSVSFGAFVLVFAAGVMYLLQERQLKLKQFDGWYRRLPALSILDDVNRAGLIFGVPIITIGMIAASVWSQQNYETMMKINFSTVTLLSGWGLFTLALVGRYAFGWRGRRTAAMAVAAFVVTVGSLIVHLG